MITADIEVGVVVHHLEITATRRRIRVRACCHHGDAELALAALSGTESRCVWTAEILQYLLRREVPFEGACEWARLPINPCGVHPGLWKAPHVKRLWMLHDLERWRREGRTPAECAVLCAHYPYRTRISEWPTIAPEPVRDGTDK